MLERVVHIRNVRISLGAFDFVEDRIGISLDVRATEFGFLQCRKAKNAIEPGGTKTKKLLPQGFIGHLAAVEIVRLAMKSDQSAKIAGFDDRTRRK